MAFLLRAGARCYQPLRSSVSLSVQSRSFADKMSFTFASPYEVSFMKHAVAAAAVFTKYRGC